MFSLPQFKQIKETKALASFADHYLKSSGLPIPDAYLYNPDNHIFGIYWNHELIGGFILGNGPDFRTIELFAQVEKQASIYEGLENRSDYTEICCFFIKRKFRTKAILNFFTWFAMTYALKRYGNQYFLFGTCSRSLARLYGQTEKSILISRDRVNQKSTFIFWAEKRTCIRGMFEIIFHKLQRTIKTSRIASLSISA